MIDEKRLIEELKKYKIDNIAINGNSIIDIINEQPKVDEWIPCSERLPEYTDEYNVTVGVACELGYFERTTTLRFERIKGKEPRWVTPKDEVYRVIAWQPLPEPYKGEQE